MMLSKQEVAELIEKLTEQHALMAEDDELCADCHARFEAKDKVERASRGLGAFNVCYCTMDD